VGSQFDLKAEPLQVYAYGIENALLVDGVHIHVIRKITVSYVGS
jgi:hypothetical protein